MKKKNTHQISLKQALIGGVIIATTAGGYFIFKGTNAKTFLVPSYKVLRVIDGDTFETAEKQLIRLSSANAPELDRCWGEEAKHALEKLIIGKPIYLKVQYRDPYYRLISMVYTPDGPVNERMIYDGNAYYAKTGKDAGDELLNAAASARENKRGIFSQKCTQVTNPKNPECSIKGNIRLEKIYYTPQCGYYNQVEVQLYHDDQWFCSESDAIKAGFRKPKDC